MIIYQIKLPKKQNAEAFVKFMQRRVLPFCSKSWPDARGSSN